MNRRAPENGFTLVELLVALAIMGVVFSVVSAAFLVSLNGARDSNDALEGSRGGAFTSNYFVKDVQSSRTVVKGSAACGAPGTANPLVMFTWQDKGVTESVDYLLADLSSGMTLTRRRCGSVSSEIEVATLLANASVTCDPTSCTTPKTVTLTLQLQASGTFTIQGSRRLP